MEQFLQRKCTKKLPKNKRGHAGEVPKQLEYKDLLQMKLWSYQQTVESRLRQPSQQPRPLQPRLTLSHVEHPDGTHHVLQPASSALLHPSLHVKLGVRQRLAVLPGGVVWGRRRVAAPQPLGGAQSKNRLAPQGVWRGLAADEGGGASIVLQANDITVGHQEVFQLILKLQDTEIVNYLRGLANKNHREVREVTHDHIIAQNSTERKPKGGLEGGVRPLTSTCAAGPADRENSTSYCKEYQGLRAPVGSWCP